jgi:hypothetical protein
MTDKKPIQTVIPQNVVNAYNALQEAHRKKQICIQYGGRGYGKTMLVELLSRVN